jgi:hypothetical protein
MVLVKMEGAASWFVASFLLQIMQEDLGKIPRGSNTTSIVLLSILLLHSLFNFQDI